MTSKETIEAVARIIYKNYHEELNRAHKLGFNCVWEENLTDDGQKIYKHTAKAAIAEYTNSEDYLEAIYAAAVELEKAEIIQEYKDSEEYKILLGDLLNITLKKDDLENKLANQRTAESFIVDDLRKLEKILKIADKEIDVLLNKYCEEKDKLQITLEALRRIKDYDGYGVTWVQYRAECQAIAEQALKDTEPAGVESSKNNVLKVESADMPAGLLKEAIELAEFYSQTIFISESDYGHTTEMNPAPEKARDFLKKIKDVSKNDTHDSEDCV